MPIHHKHELDPNLLQEQCMLLITKLSLAPMLGFLKWAQDLNSLSLRGKQAAN